MREGDEDPLSSDSLFVLPEAAAAAAKMIGDILPFSIDVLLLLGDGIKGFNTLFSCGKSKRLLYIVFEQKHTSCLKPNRAASASVPCL